MKRAPSPATPDDVLRYIAGYLEAHGGVSPSYQNVCDALGIGSKHTVSRVIHRLQDLGLVRHLRRRAFSLDVLAPVAVPRCPRGAPLYFVRVQP